MREVLNDGDGIKYSPNRCVTGSSVLELAKRLFGKKEIPKKENIFKGKSLFYIIEHFTGVPLTKSTFLGERYVTFTGMRSGCILQVYIDSECNTFFNPTVYVGDPRIKKYEVFRDQDLLWSCDLFYG
jgi:hypothetical protein